MGGEERGVRVRVRREGEGGRRDGEGRERGRKGGERREGGEKEKRGREDGEKKKGKEEEGGIDNQATRCFPTLISSYFIIHPPRYTLLQPSVLSGECKSHPATHQLQT